MQNFSRWGFGLDNAKFCVGYTNMLVSKTLKFALPPKRNIKFVLLPMQNPNASQWNIGCVGSPTNVLAMYISCYLFSFQFAVEYGLKSQIMNFDEWVVSSWLQLIERNLSVN